MRSRFLQNGYTKSCHSLMILIIRVIIIIVIIILLLLLVLGNNPIFLRWLQLSESHIFTLPSHHLSFPRRVQEMKLMSVWNQGKKMIVHMFSIILLLHYLGKKLCDCFPCDMWFQTRPWDEDYFRWFSCRWSQAHCK